MQSMIINKILGDLLQETRKSKGMKQVDVAACMGIDFQVVSDYENGRRNPGIDWLFRACDCLEVDFGEFMTELNNRRKFAVERGDL
jgi:transcriptional regulator with XRE-family HTH domain